jgi:hypothetical protein
MEFPNYILDIPSSLAFFFFFAPDPQIFKYISKMIQKSRSDGLEIKRPFSLRMALGLWSLKISFCCMSFVNVGGRGGTKWKQKRLCGCWKAFELMRSLTTGRRKHFQKGLSSGDCVCSRIEIKFVRMISV